MSIKVLEPNVAAKIAAGEVVERPASVVKELVENSLDAGASHVTVEVRGGGLELLRVTDNGCGMPADSVELAFHRHATSKISSISDLDSIGTLGFRGEALPSIAAVARVSLVTRTADSPSGREVHLKWGEVVRAGTKGCPPGTAVTVQGLFQNVPARLKFLKSASGEAGRISSLVSRYALAYPEVQFRLLGDGRNSLASPGNGSLADALASVYGPETAQSLMEVSHGGAEDSYTVAGYASPPSLNRANRSYITFLVNRRWIQSSFLSYALTESYQGFLPDKRYPVAVLNLTVPPSDVDVNVHPTKREVRFRQENRVFTTLQRAVRGALVAISPVPEVQVSEGAPAGQVRPQTPGVDSSAFAADQWQKALPLEPTPFGPQTAATLGQAIPTLRILGQVRATYLVAEGADGLYLVDQHAAHERVLFEKVCKAAANKAPQMQTLLEPESVELSPGQEELVNANAHLLERYGFVLEPFGDRTYLMRAMPAVVKGSGPSKALLEVLDLMAYEGLLKELEGALAASIACHSAVRAGMALSQREMEELVGQLEACEAPHTCPHGRPTMIRLSSHHLEREFGRR